MSMEDEIKELQSTIITLRKNYETASTNAIALAADSRELQKREYKYRTKISSLEAKLAIAKEALRWYAVDDNPAGCQTARNALSKLNEEAT